MNEDFERHYNILKTLRDYYAESDEKMMRAVAPAFDTALNLMNKEKDNARRISNRCGNVLKRFMQK